MSVNFVKISCNYLKVYRRNSVKVGRWQPQATCYVQAVATGSFSLLFVTTKNLELQCRSLIFGSGWMIHRYRQAASQPYLVSSLWGAWLMSGVGGCDEVGYKAVLIKKWYRFITNNFNVNKWNNYVLLMIFLIWRTRLKQFWEENYWYWHNTRLIIWSVPSALVEMFCYKDCNTCVAVDMSTAVLSVTKGVDRSFDIFSNKFRYCRTFWKFVEACWSYFVLEFISV